MVSQVLVVYVAEMFRVVEFTVGALILNTLPQTT